MKLKIGPVPTSFRNSSNQRRRGWIKDHHTMSETTEMVPYIASLVLNGFGLVIGTLFAFMGYRLFLNGIFNPADLEATWKDKKIALGKAAPGIFFALFGVTVIGIVFYKQISITESESTPISYDALNTIQNVVLRRYVSAQDSKVLRDLVKDRFATIKSNSYVYETRDVSFKLPPKEVFDRIIEGKKLATDERMLMLEWYGLAARTPEFPQEIANTLDNALLRNASLDRPERELLKAWREAPGQFRNEIGVGVPSTPTLRPEVEFEPVPAPKS